MTLKQTRIVIKANDIHQVTQIGIKVETKKKLKQN